MVSFSVSAATLRKDGLLDTAAFLAFLDARPGEQWELLDGQPVRMVGGPRAHARIAGICFRPSVHRRERGDAMPSAAFW
jgi:hypothetical protein